MAASFGVILDNATAKGVRGHGRVALLDELQAVARRRWTEQQGTHVAVVEPASHQPHRFCQLSVNAGNLDDVHYGTCVIGRAVITAARLKPGLLDMNSPLLAGRNVAGTGS